MTPGIKAIREANTGTDCSANIHPASVIALCDLIDTLQADCNEERSRRMALLEELEKQHDEVERLRKDAARLDHVLKWDDGCWTSREQIDKSIADDAAMEAKQ